MNDESSALLVGFLNTLHLPDGVDALAGSSPEQWLADGLVNSGRSIVAAPTEQPTEDDLRLGDLRTLREGLRELTRPDSGTVEERRRALRRAQSVLRSVALTVELPDEVAMPPRLVPATRGRLAVDGRLALVAGAYMRCTASGSFSRVKTCALVECQWAFYDTSRNQSRRWCAMTACGNRVKNRAYRARATRG